MKSVRRAPSRHRIAGTSAAPFGGSTHRVFARAAGLHARARGQLTVRLLTSTLAMGSIAGTAAVAKLCAAAWRPTPPRSGGLGLRIADTSHQSAGSVLTVVADGIPAPGPVGETHTSAAPSGNAQAQAPAASMWNALPRLAGAFAADTPAPPVVGPARVTGPSPAATSAGTLRPASLSTAPPPRAAPRTASPAATSSSSPVPR